MIYYFAYGSNMDVTRLERDRLNKEGISSVSRTLGRLDGYELVFNKPSAYFIGAGAANIAEDPQSSIYGTLNHMPAGGLAILDKYENVETGQYERLDVEVFDCDTERMVRAVTYISRNHNIAGLKPRSGYMDHVLGGVDILPSSYVDYLKSIPLMQD